MIRRCAKCKSLNLGLVWDSVARHGRKQCLDCKSTGPFEPVGPPAGREETGGG